MDLKPFKKEYSQNGCVKVRFTISMGNRLVWISKLCGSTEIWLTCLCFRSFATNIWYLSVVGKHSIGGSGWTDGLAVVYRVLVVLLELLLPCLHGFIFLRSFLWVLADSKEFLLSLVWQGRWWWRNRIVSLLLHSLVPSLLQHLTLLLPG